jgi:hypothetical protein
LNFSYYGLEKQIIIQIIFDYDDGTSFGYSWKPEQGNKWVGLEALFEDFTVVEPGTSPAFASMKLDPKKVEKLEITCLPNQNSSPGYGRIIVDNLQGVTNIPLGSPWERAEAVKKKTIAMNLAYESEEARKDPRKFIESIKLAVESLGYNKSPQGDLALRRGLALLPSCLAQLRHNGPVLAVAFSPDGLELATASLDYTARIWNVRTGEEMHRLQHDGSVYSVVFSPDGRKLATASADNTSKI